MSLYDQFESIFVHDGKYAPSKWKSQSAFRTLIEQSDMGDFITIDEKIMALRFKLVSRPVCVVCRINFTKTICPSKDNPNGFRATCSVKCAANHSKTKLKTKETLDCRYGGHHMKNAALMSTYVEKAHAVSAYARGKQTMLKNYGVTSCFATDETKQKIKDANISRYGAANAMSSEVVRAKAKKTTLDRHGAFFNPQKTSQTIFEEHGVRNARQIPGVSEKIIDTCLKLYGVPHPMQNQEVKQRVRNTNLKRYGVCNPMSNSEVVAKGRNKNLLTTFNRITLKLSDVAVPLFSADHFSGTRKLYDWRCVTCSSEFKDHLTDGRIPRCFECNPVKFGKMEDELRDEIDKLCGVSSIKLRGGLGDTRQEIDIYLPDRKIGIEFNGAHWHSDKFKDRMYHKNKTLLAQQHGIQLIHIFENDWLNKKDKVLSLLSAKLGLNKKIAARKCEVRSVSSAESNAFLEKYHLDNFARGDSVRLGLYLKNELIMIATFGKPRYDKTYTWELYRLASKSQITVVGGVSRLIKKFTDTNPGSLMTYADLSHSDGKSYAKAGMVHVGNTPPGYFYIDKNTNKISRYAAQKSKLNRLLGTENLSEAEAASRLRYTKIWNCGNAIYAIGVQA